MLDLYQVGGNILIFGRLYDLVNKIQIPICYAFDEARMICDTI